MQIRTLVLVALLGALSQIAMGCDQGKTKSSHPAGTASQAQYHRLPEGDRAPVGPQPSADGLVVGGGKQGGGSLLFGGSSSGGCSGQGGGLGLFGAGLLVAGAIAARKKSWRWAVTLLGAGLAAGFVGGGLSIGFGWWKIAWLVYLVIWVVSLNTDTRWDDRIVNVGAVAILGVGLLAQAMPFLNGWFGLPTLGWTLIHALGVFLIARGIWEEEHFQGGQRWLYTALLWVVLLITR